MSDPTGTSRPGTPDPGPTESDRDDEMAESDEQTEDESEGSEEEEADEEPEEPGDDEEADKEADEETEESADDEEADKEADEEPEESADDEEADEEADEEPEESADDEEAGDALSAAGDAANAAGSDAPDATEQSCSHETRFLVYLENPDGTPIPEAEYEVTLADGSTRTGRLDRNGQGIVLDPPPGPVTVAYTDPEDVKAKSLAAQANAGCKAKDAGKIHFVLGHSSALLKTSAEAYATYFNDLSGNGMVEDIYNSVRGINLKVAILLMARGGLPTHENVTYYYWDQDAR